MQKQLFRDTDLQMPRPLRAARRQLPTLAETQHSASADVDRAPEPEATASARRQLSEKPSAVTMRLSLARRRAAGRRFISLDLLGPNIDILDALRSPKERRSDVVARLLVEEWARRHSSGEGIVG